jgi:hypothetical protein
MLVLGCRIGAVLNQELCDLDVTQCRSPVQRSRPIFGLSGRIGTVLDQELCEPDVTP